MNKKVLLVEDETDLRKMMKILLEIHGFNVIEAADGYEAVEKAVDDERKRQPRSDQFAHVELSRLSRKVWIALLRCNDD